MAAPLKKMMRCLFIRNICQSRRKYATIKELLNRNNNGSVKVEAEGWLTSCRKQKHVTFFRLNDGTSRESLQVVADTKMCDSDLGMNCSVRVEGNLVQSPGAGQALEIQAEKVDVIGKCDVQEYPFKPRQTYSLSQIREHLHLRPRTEYFTSLLKVRNAATMAVHKFFQDNGYMLVHTPVITSNDCEGAGETFTVQSNKQIELREDSDSDATSPQPDSTVTKDRFFGSPAYLSVSGQLHLEAITGRFNKAYCFGPTFRAENAIGRHHLSEFYMIEAEVAFIRHLEAIIEIMENLVKSVTENVMSQCSEEVEGMRKLGSNDSTQQIDAILNKKFIRLTYSEAIELLEKQNHKFKYQVKWGCDLQKEHEKFLVNHCGNTLVFVTDFPASIKPFYARENPDKETVSAVDLLAPEVGELIGGSLREERLDILEPRMDRLGLPKSLDWYLDLRRFGSVPHGGFGLGFERYLQCILGVQNIKDTTLFPRWMLHCDM